MTGPAVRRAGTAIFLAGLALFAWTVGAGGYRITSATLEHLGREGVLRGDHREAVLRELATLEGRDHASAFGFVPAVNAALRRASEGLPQESKIWDYDRGQYEIGIAREAATGFAVEHTRLLFWLCIVGGCAGALLSFLPPLFEGPGGIRNDDVFRGSTRSRGVVGVVLGAGLIAFYIGLYFYPMYVTGWIRLADPVSQVLRGRPADRWFFYGLLYTLAVLVMGVRMLVHYRHSRYHVVRTTSVMFFQLGFAFLIPAVLARLNRPEVDLKNAWPLDYSFFYSYRIDAYTSGGAFGWFVLIWGIALAFAAVPLLAVFFGKRWYCSWVCGCGGLAETLGDPFRHLSDKSLRAWKVERYTVHGVLVFAVALTAIVVVNYFTGRDGTPWLGQTGEDVKRWYGFLIGSIFAGVVGTGFYPLMGNRVWCRFGCPLAAILGFVQRFRSRFRITTNGGQCISCGNCSTYCEMGIDVRWYAQRGQNVVRSSCVGCGICAAVCPRGVLRLENGPLEGRLDRVDLLQIGNGRIAE